MSPKIYVIGRREYQAAVRTKAFVISLVLMPVFMLGGIFVQKLLRGRIDIDDRVVVVLDGTGRLFAALVEATEARNQSEITDPRTGKQVESKYILEPGSSGDVTDEVRLTLSERVRKHQVYAFVEIDPDAIERPQGASGPSVRIHSERLSSNELSRWLTRTIHQAIATERLRASGIDPGLVAKATAPVAVDVLGLFDREADGRIIKADESSRQAAFFLPMAIMMLMFMSLMMSQTLLQSSLEEKQQRIAEVLLGSATPFQLMLGKLLGNVGVSLTMVGLYLAGGWWMLDHYGYAHLVPSNIVFWFLVYQVLGVLLYGSVFIAIGAACTELKEAQNLLMPVMLILVMPMMVWFNVLEEPTSAFSTWLSLFPPATPMLMLLRMSATGAIPIWQPILGIMLVLVFTLIAVFAAGRVFRIGLLSQGKAPKIRELAQWIVRG